MPASNVSTAAITPLVLVNRACAMIGEEPLDDLTDETPAGAKVAALYDSLADMMLAYPFTFTRETVQLARQVPPSTDPAHRYDNGYKHKYTLPNGFSIKPNRLLASKDNDDVITAIEYEGDALYCNEEKVWAQILINQHPERWAGDFRHAFCVALAAELAMALADDKSVAMEMREKAFGSPSMNYRGGLYGVAIQNDARNAPVRKVPLSNPLLDAYTS